MAQKCVHQGCGKQYTDPDEVCRYHPGPPVFHEGQKGTRSACYRTVKAPCPTSWNSEIISRLDIGWLHTGGWANPTTSHAGWKCCKPRVLTFEEFMAIEPCTEGKHSTTDLPPKIEKKEANKALLEAANLPPPPPRAPVTAPLHIPTPPPPPPESEDDDDSVEIPDGRVCRRKGCGTTYKKGASRQGETCVHHPGVPIFHEGSKGYSCCKRRVLEFDQFMKIEGCKTKDRHLFVGSGKKGAEGKGPAGQGGEELLETVRLVFYRA